MQRMLLKWSEEWIAYSSEGKKSEGYKNTKVQVLGRGHNLLEGGQC